MSLQIFKNAFREVMRMGIAKARAVQSFYDENPHLDWQICHTVLLRDHLKREIKEWKKKNRPEELLDIINLAVMLYTRETAYTRRERE